MLCDESHEMLKSYKAWGLKKFMGRVMGKEPNLCHDKRQSTPPQIVWGNV